MADSVVTREHKIKNSESPLYSLDWLSLLMLNWAWRGWYSSWLLWNRHLPVRVHRSAVYIKEGEQSAAMTDELWYAHDRVLLSSKNETVFTATGTELESEMSMRKPDSERWHQSVHMQNLKERFYKSWD